MKDTKLQLMKDFYAEPDFMQTSCFFLLHVTLMQLLIEYW